jgi:hypothetical protein
MIQLSVLWDRPKNPIYPLFNPRRIGRNLHLITHEGCISCFLKNGPVRLITLGVSRNYHMYGDTGYKFGHWPHGRVIKVVERGDSPAVDE